MPRKDRKDGHVVMMRDDAAAMLKKTRANIWSSPDIVAELGRINAKRVAEAAGGRGCPPHLVTNSDIILISLRALDERYGLTNKETK